MSLLVWLPLNNDLRNNGVNNASFSYVNNNGKLGVNSSGKIGKCYERTASGYADCYRSSSNFNLTGDISMACWAYVSSTIGDRANGLITNHNHVDSSGVGITVKQVSTSDYRISCNTGTGSSRTYSSYYGTTNIKNAWHHLALTYSKSAKILKLYVDGNAEYTLNNYDNYAANNPFDIFNWSTGHYANGDYRPVCKLNDVRLYDNELSQAEVKELAKCLVMHYPLTGGKSGANILKNSSADYGASHTSYNIYDYNFSEALVSGTTYTYSCKINASSEKKSICLYHSGGSIQIGPWTTKNTSGIYTYTFTATSDMASQTSGSGYGFCRVYVSNNNGIQGSTALSGTANVDWIKIEKGSKATPWCPNSADSQWSSMGYSSTTEMDTSGNAYNGTRTGTLTYSQDSARNNVCTTFSDGTYIQTGLVLGDYANKYTFSWWGKLSNVSGKMMWGFTNGNRLNVFLSSGYYHWNTGDGDQNRFGSITIASTAGDGNWHHFAVTGDGSTVKLYIDGVYKANATTWKAITGTTLIFNGWDTSNSYNFNGSLSDFRLYGTCFTADQVKEIYQKSASISNTGVLTANEFIEL